MMIFRGSCAEDAIHLASSTASHNHRRPIFILTSLELRKRQTVHRHASPLSKLGLGYSETRPRREIRSFPSPGKRQTLRPKTRTRHMPHGLPASRPMNRSKKLAESTSTATFALGTNLSRRMGDVFVLARVGADPRIAMCRATCFSISGRRRKSPAVGL